MEGTHNESICFNLDRQKHSLIPPLTFFPPHCPDYAHSATLLLHPLPSGLKSQVQENGNHWVENARWQHSGVFAIGQWTMRGFPEPLVVRMEQLDTNTQIGVGRDHAEQQEKLKWDLAELKLTVKSPLQSEVSCRIQTFWLHPNVFPGSQGTQKDINILIRFDLSNVAVLDPKLKSSKLKKEEGGHHLLFGMTWISMRLPGYGSSKSVFFPLLSVCNNWMTGSAVACLLSSGE